MGAYTDFHRRSIEDREAFWARAGAARSTGTSRSKGARLQPAAVRALVRRRPHQSLPQRGRPPSRDARRPEGARSTSPPRPAQERTYTYRELHAEVNRCAGDDPVAGRGQGRPRAHLHADDPGGGVRDARLRAPRRDPLGGVRRLRRAQPRRAHRRRAPEADDHRRRRHARRARRSSTSRWSTRRSGSRSTRRSKVVDRRTAASTRS